MQATNYITSLVNKFPKGYIFTYADINGEANKREAIIKCLNRLAASGKICKLAKGKFYKPETSSFGILEPTQYQIVKDLLEKNGKVIGYLTGYAAYSEMGLSTQISNTIQIGRNEAKAALKRSNYKIAFIKQKNRISKSNVYLLQLLDAIRFIKTIPDATIAESCIRIMALIKKLTTEEKEALIKLALKYPPATRALLGALIEQAKCKTTTDKLRRSLNPISAYKLNVSAGILPTAKSWNIR